MTAYIITGLLCLAVIVWLMFSAKVQDWADNMPEPERTEPKTVRVLHPLHDQEWDG